MEKAPNYLKLNNKYLKEADALIGKRDYVQASEKFWGAAAHQNFYEDWLPPATVRDLGEAVKQLVARLKTRV